MSDQPIRWKVIQGDDFRRALKFKSNGTPIDLTGTTIRWQIRNQDTNALVIEGGWTIDPGTGGTAELFVLGADTLTFDPRMYSFDVKWTPVDGRTKTIAFGDFFVKKTVTQ